MIITKDSPEFYDLSVAAKTASFYCLLCAFWFLLTPLTFFGVSTQTSGWNCWIVGGLLVLSTLIRVIHPQGTAGFSLFNAILSVWVLASPFVFGYTHETYRVINTLAIGSATLTLSLTSLLSTRNRGFDAL
jgi:hypothetical protein